MYSGAKGTDKRDTATYSAQFRRPIALCARVRSAFRCGLAQRRPWQNTSKLIDGLVALRAAMCSCAARAGIGDRRASVARRPRVFIDNRRAAKCCGGGCLLRVVCGLLGAEIRPVARPGAERNDATGELRDFDVLKSRRQSQKATAGGVIDPLARPSVVADRVRGGGAKTHRIWAYRSHRNRRIRNARIRSAFARIARIYRAIWRSGTCGLESGRVLADSAAGARRNQRDSGRGR